MVVTKISRVNILRENCLCKTVLTNIDSRVKFTIQHQNALKNVLMIRQIDRAMS